MKTIHATLSMLHEPVNGHSADRQFRGDPVISWTVERLSQSQLIQSMTVLCWEDQRFATEKALQNAPIEVQGIGQRHAEPLLDAVAAARRWADGWRGGPWSTCDFDLGFHPRLARDLALARGADALLLVDPAAGLVDSALVDQLIAHGRSQAESLIYFTSAAPGLCGVLLRLELLEQLARTHTHAGRLLHYMPDQPTLDPISGKGHFFVPAPVARTLQTFKINSDRQAARLATATEDLNGHLVATEAEELVKRMESAVAMDRMPRDVVLELTVRRATSPIFSPAGQVAFDRGDADRATVQKAIEELARVDDVRLTLGGVGDPMLHPQIDAIIGDIRSAGIRAVHVETDLLSLSPAAFDVLASGGIDIVSVHLPALSAETYAAVMGQDGYATVIDNLRRLIEARSAEQRGTPLVMPVFMKCRGNFAEMEPWYDQWLRALGCAVIAGPSTFAGQIADTAQADMSPPKRRPCQRLRSRLTILSNGQIVSCEEDVTARQVMGTIGTDTIGDAWTGAMARLRGDHKDGNFSHRPLCAKCTEWHRP